MSEIKNETILALDEQRGHDIVIPIYADIALQTKDIFVFAGYSERKIGYAKNINLVGDDRIEADIILDDTVTVTKEHIFRCQFLTHEKYMFWFGGKRYIKKVRIIALHFIKEGEEQ